MQRLFLTLAALALLLVLGLGLRSASRFKAPSSFGALPRPGLPGDIGLRFTDVRLIGRAGGKRAWLLTAGRLDSARNRSRLDLSQKIEATALQDGKIRAILRAPNAVYEPLLHRVTASGGIDATSLENGKPQALVRAPRAVYELEAKTIRAEGGTTMTLLEAGKPRAKITSATLTDELGPRRVTALGGVEAVLPARSPAEKLARLAAPKAIWNQAARTLSCPEGGRLTRGTFVLEAASLSANLKSGLYAATRGHGSFDIDELKELTP